MVKITRLALLALGVGILSISCQKDTEVEEIVSESNLQVKIQTKSPESLTWDQKFQNVNLPPTLQEHARDLVIRNGVAPSECGYTEFTVVQDEYLGLLANDLFALFVDPVTVNDVFNTYLTLSQYSALIDSSEPYFGEKGEYTKFMARRTRELERFWNMPGLVVVKGQHSEALNNREKLADVYELIGTNISTREEAYAAADFILLVNSLSTQIPESPFFSVDGFTLSHPFFGEQIVIGDGLVAMIAETGISTEIVYTGILAHEWAHQVQFKNYDSWYPNGAAEDAAADTRHTELEADFFASYYMTHKKGATYNWKRVEEFLNLYFQIGDCGFDNPSHHGTPSQRLNAAYLGYQVAQAEQKKGQQLSDEELHVIFMTEVDNLL